SSHQGEGAAHTRSKKTGSPRINVRLLNQPVIRHSDIPNVLGIQAQIPHGRRPADERREAGTRQCFLQTWNLWVIDAEGDDAQAYHDARVGTACRWPVELAFHLAMMRWILHVLYHRWACHPVHWFGWQHR